MAKKTSTIKASDAGKPWNKQKSTSKYKIKTRIANKIILIVCEGQTEKMYFESFPVYTATTLCVDTKGRSKQSLVDETAKIIKRKKGMGETFDEIWCVFDMDVKRGAKEFADFDNAIYSAINKGYKVAYSNDAFEIWYYLHFQYTEQANHRTFYYQQLSSRWGFNYEKLGKEKGICCKTYEKLLIDEDASQERAIINAKRLHRQYDGNSYHDHNPVTTVYLLVEELNKYLKR